MNRILTVGVLCTALFGCASSGRIGELPDITGGVSSSELVLIRPSNLIGAANSYYVSFDGKDVFSIRSGDYTKFRVPSGAHIVSVKCFGGWSPAWKEDGKQFVAAPNQSNYFEISPSLTCAKIVQIGGDEATKLLAASRFVSPSMVSNKVTDTSTTGIDAAPQSETRGAQSHDSPSHWLPPTPAANSLRTPGAIPAQSTSTPEFRRIGTAGGRILISSHAEWDRFCRARAVPSVTVLQQPKHGHIEIEETDFVITSARASTDCLGQTTHGRSVTYIPDDGFRGVDQMIFRVTSPFADAVHTAEISVQ